MEEAAEAFLACTLEAAICMLLRLRIEATGMASRRCETKRRRTRRKRSWKEEVPPTNEHENLTTHFISLGLKQKGLCFQHTIPSV